MGEWTVYSWIIIAVGFSASVATSMLGVFLVLRRMSLITDAISHAVLPGIAIAFLISGSRDIIPMMIGAAAFGVLTTVLIEWLHQNGRIQSDAATGIIFTALFALGVVLISAKAGMVDLDQECVLYGEIAYAPWDELMIGGTAWGSRPLWILGLMAVVNVLFVTVFFKELKISTFDTALATSLGFSAVGIHYALMSLVSLTTVAAFESVGAILVVAMFVVPASTAYLLTTRLEHMLKWVILISAVIAVGGYALARVLDASIAGSMTVVAGGLFLLALIFSPVEGLLPRWLARFGLRVRIAGEDWLTIVYRRQESSAPPQMVDEAASALSRRSWLPWWLKLQGLAIKTAGQWSLTTQGQELARDIIRRHRSWEGYLHEELNVPADHVHRPAHDVEHFISDDTPGAEDVLTLDRQDPHGREIPG